MSLIPLSEGRGEIAVLRSRFLSRLLPIYGEEEALSFLEKERQSNPGARHVAYAFRMGTLEKASDDGEPRGSAGAPLLSLLRGKDVDGGLLMVTRYFGGTLLGAGRLMHAYEESGRLALESARFGKAEQGIEREMEANYKDFALIESLSRSRGITIQGLEFGMSVRFLLRGSATILPAFLEGIRLPSLKRLGERAVALVEEIR